MFSTQRIDLISPMYFSLIFEISILFGYDLVQTKNSENNAKLTFKPIEMTLDELFDATDCGLGITIG